ncbi:glutamate racemase [Leucobacter sp. OH1287]|uniref:glutamate racemase n=1 Tax=Leucobacter sp. OH1287 TaxID=2491049 RepID=UPI000F5E049B|nr:glutamate racemase [Leucobacter sp. OH1287]RRD60504.1 glutamate racemase [Leucobacter sp. OH1287]
MTEKALCDLPIGVFDSGVGGLTVARAIRDLLPHESIIYAADTARNPYGPRPIEEVRKFSLEILDALVARGVKMLVIACNTASAAVLRDAYERYTVPVVEVIAPTVRNAIALSRNGRIGLIGTATTVRSRAYNDFFAINPEVKLFTRATPRFVELVEAGITAGAEVEEVAADYLQPLLSNDIDTLVLGCTHYPFLRGALRQVAGPNVALVSSDTETANEVYRVLRDKQLLRTNSATPATIHYTTTGSDIAGFQALAQQMLRTDAPLVSPLTLGDGAVVDPGTPAGSAGEAERPDGAERLDGAERPDGD